MKNKVNHIFNKSFGFNRKTLNPMVIEIINVMMAVIILIML